MFKFFQKIKYIWYILNKIEYCQSKDNLLYIKFSSEIVIENDGYVALSAKSIQLNPVKLNSFSLTTFKTENRIIQ
jgi:hypothetical protein